MEEISSLWNYQETIDELKQQLLYTTLEIESVRAQSNAERESTMQLFQLVKKVCKERDEARAQLQKLLTKVMPSSSIDSPLIKPNSSLTKSRSFSDTYNSSPANASFSDPVSSPNLSHMNQSFDQAYHDEGSLVIDKLVEGKPLPAKGKLLQAVLGAGPLLQTLMVAGHLPRWRNPPPKQPLELPQFCINRGLDTSFGPKLLATPLLEMNYGPSPMMSTSSMVDFGSSYDFSRKRQRWQ